MWNDWNASKLFRIRRLRPYYYGCLSHWMHPCIHLSIHGEWSSPSTGCCVVDCDVTTSRRHSILLWWANNGPLRFAPPIYSTLPTLQRASERERERERETSTPLLPVFLAKIEPIPIHYLIAVLNSLDSFKIKLIDRLRPLPFVPSSGHHNGYNWDATARTENRPG